MRTLARIRVSFDWRTRTIQVRLAALLLCLFVVGCGGKKAPVVEPPPRVEIVTVKEPVPFRVQPPPELLAPFKFPLPVFVSPFDADATSALTAEGERLLRGLIEELLQQIAAWKAWATAKE